MIDLKKKADADTTPAGEARDKATAPRQPRSKSPEASASLTMPQRAPVSLPDKSRRLPEMSGGRGRRPDKARRDDGKLLVVGREIVLSGVFEGELTAREHLVVRATGRITGKVRFGELEIERGGQIIGDVQVFGNGAAPGKDAKSEADTPDE